jgi:hypothetical protein
MDVESGCFQSPIICKIGRYPNNLRKIFEKNSNIFLFFCNLLIYINFLFYLSNDKTICGCWLAWAKMAVAACWTICVRANSLVAVA